MKTYYVTLEYAYYEIDVEAETEEAAIKEAKDVVRRGFITPSYVNETVSE